MERAHFPIRCSLSHAAGSGLCYGTANGSNARWNFRPSPHYIEWPAHRRRNSIFTRFSSVFMTLALRPPRGEHFTTPSQKTMKPAFRPKPLVRKVPLNISGMDDQGKTSHPLYTEWIITNGLGGYASGTIGGLNTRRFHGWLIAALPAPHGRVMMANSLRECLYIRDRPFVFSSQDFVPHQETDRIAATSDPVLSTTDPTAFLQEFRLETGLPVWVFRVGDALLEKRVCMVHAQNTTCITYTLLGGEGSLDIQPALHVRSHEGSLEGPPHAQYRFTTVEQGFELCVSETLPPLKFAWHGEQSSFHTGMKQITNLRYRIEQSRGYDWEGGLWSPGGFAADRCSHEKKREVPHRRFH
jgi:hypothetical protein